LFVLSSLGVLLLAVRALPQSQALPQPRPVQRIQVRPAQPTNRVVPRLVAVAETKLLMDGLLQPNFRGLEGILKEKPDSDEAWTFARGQALLIAETGNLLLLRPPHNQGRDTWQQRAMDLRSAATNLARTVAARDFERSRAQMLIVANVCNRCHQTFKVTTRVSPFAAPGEPPTPGTGP
jgi:hypothetical protein